jgi:hypothetical protein
MSRQQYRADKIALAVTGSIAHANASSGVKRPSSGMTSAHAAGLVSNGPAKNQQVAPFFVVFVALLLVTLLAVILERVLPCWRQSSRVVVKIAQEGHSIDHRMRAYATTIPARSKSTRRGQPELVAPLPRMCPPPRLSETRSPLWLSSACGLPHLEDVRCGEAS